MTRETGLQMNDRIIAYDLGTGGIKASLYEMSGTSIFDVFFSYDTDYSSGNIHEQSPDVWWQGIIRTTQKLLTDTKTAAASIVGIAISGHSLGAVPVDINGDLLRELTPIWSDTRAEAQTEAFFEKIDYNNWYMTTGNGFPAECYSVFKVMWYRDNEPEMFAKVHKILGSKDYCNLRLTGKMYTDQSYASGSGIFDLQKNMYRSDFADAAGLDLRIFPEILKSHDVVGNLTAEAAAILGLTEQTKVICGGVDNACMALGARGFKNGRAYISLGSSSWIAIVGDKPIVDIVHKPFVFSHVVDGMYTSATSIFAAGSSLRWVRDNICTDVAAKEAAGEIPDAYIEMNRMAEKSTIGANGLIFNPSLAGGAMIEESKHICGGFIGLNLRHNRNDLVRATMEGITYNLFYAMEILAKYAADIDQMLLVGGGSKSAFWRQMFSDVFAMDMIKTTVDQNCASLGAAALVAYGLGYWSDYSQIDSVHQQESVHQPDPENTAQYRNFYNLHRASAHYFALSGESLHKMGY